MHSCSKTGKKNQWLSRSITLALLSCMWLPLNNAQAATVNMTNADNTVIEKYAYGTDNTYIYGHDSTAPATITGGTITIKKTETGESTYDRPSITLQTDNVGINMNDNTEVLAVLNALAGKLTCYGDYVDKYGGYYSYNINGKAQIAEGLTSQSAMLRSGNIGFDSSVASSSGDVDKLYAVSFASPITGDATNDKEYAAFINDAGVYDLSKITAVTIKPAFSSDYDPTYAAIRPASDKNLTYKGKGYGNTTAFTVDASKLQYSKAYGVYDDKNAMVDLQGTTALTINVIGQGESGGLYAGLKSGDGQSFVNLANVDITGSGSTFYGIQAMRNGYVDANQVKITTDKGYGLFASNGGKIIIDNLVMTGDGIHEIIHADTGATVSVGIRYNNPIGYVASVLKGNVAAETGAKVDLALGGSAGAQWVGNAKGTVNVYLTNSESNWNGDADGDGSIKVTGGNWKGNAGGAYNVNLSGTWAKWTGGINGQINNLSLLNGAAWINNNYSSAAEINSFNGSAKTSARGSIYQDSDKGLSFNNYSGNSLVIFSHDAANPLKIKGGDVTIASAQKTAGSNAGIVLRTDNSGIDTSDSGVVKSVLDNLAAKLIYTGYTTGERNLDGRVEIAEGLTATSAYCKYSSINFDAKTGRGTADAKVTSPYLSAITGSLDADAEYKKTGVTTENGIYNFKEDTVIATNYDVNNGYLPEIATPVGNGSYQISQPTTGSINNNGNGDVTIDMNGNNLYVENKTTVGRKFNMQYYVNRSAGIFAEKEGTITINNPGAISIENNADYYYAAGIYTGKGNVIINNDNDPAHAVKIRGSLGGGDASFAMNWTGIKTFGGEVNIKGLADIYSDGAWAIGSAPGVISIGGGSIVSNNYESIDAYGGGTVSVNTIGSGDAMTAGTNDLVVKGNIKTQGSWVGAGSGGTINLGFTTDKSEFIGLSNRAVTNTGVKVGVVNMFLQNGATWINQDGWKNGDDSAISTSSKTNSNVDVFHGGVSADKYGVIIQKNANKIVLDKYSGYTHAIFTHDSADPTMFSGGNVVINSAEKTNGTNASITLLTDNSGIDTKDTATVANVLSALAKKLTYTNYAVIQPAAADAALKTNEIDDVSIGENNLDGKVGIAEGLTSTSAITRIGDIAFSANDGSGSLKDGSVVAIEPVPSDPKIIYGSKETAMMRGAKTAMTSSILAWRAENSDFAERMGDLRKTADEDGIWARVYGGKDKYDKDNTSYENSFKTMQVGLDRALGSNGWHAGAGFSYMDGNSDYELGGKGDNKAYSLAVYGSWLGNEGQYLDLVLKGSKLENDYTVYNDMGHKLTGDYDTWGTSLSAEYGKKITGSDGFYWEPQAQITYSRLNSADYNAHSDFGDGKDMRVEQDGMNSLVGRLGIGMGKDTSKGTMYAKVSLAHEFCGDITTAFSAVNEPTSSVSQDFGDTWVEFNVGGSQMLNKNTYLYADFTKSAGADVSVDWKANAGVRWTF